MFTDRQQQDTSGREYSAQTDGECLDWNIVFAEKVTCNTAAGDRVEGAESGPASAHGEGFVEADMAIEPNT